VSVGSDNGVDLAVEPLLPVFGYACEVGANNGVFNSNTLMYERNGWIVLCIEPNPLLATAGRGARKLWRQVACGAEDAENQRFEVYRGYPHASFSSFKDRYGSPSEPTSIQYVTVRRLDRVLEEAGFPRLDLLCVDVEGWEPEVMAGFTVERWKPIIIVVEDVLNRGSNPPPGYREIEKRIFDRIYQRIEMETVP